MKKLAKISIFMMAAAIFFAGCSSPTNTTSEPSPDIEVSDNKITLSDGRWDMDTETISKTTLSGFTTETKVVQHVEMNISGDNLEILKATQKVDDGETQDITNEMKTKITQLSDVVNSSNYLDKAAPSGQSGYNSMMTLNTKTYKNKEETKYKVISNAQMDASNPLVAMTLAMMVASDPSMSGMDMSDFKVVMDSVINYVKK